MSPKYNYIQIANSIWLPTSIKLIIIQDLDYQNFIILPKVHEYLDSSQLFILCMKQNTEKGLNYT